MSRHDIKVEIIREADGSTVVDVHYGPQSYLHVYGRCADKVLLAQLIADAVDAAASLALNTGCT